MSLLVVLKSLCGILSVSMITIILCILFYILGILILYISSVLYFYYVDNPKSFKADKLKFAKQKAVEEFTELGFFLSWIFLISLLIFITFKMSKYVVDKLLEVIIL